MQTLWRVRLTSVRISSEQRCQAQQTKLEKIIIFFIIKKMQMSVSDNKISFPLTAIPINILISAPPRIKPEETIKPDIINLYSDTVCDQQTHNPLFALVVMKVFSSLSFLAQAE